MPFATEMRLPALPSVVAVNVILVVLLNVAVTPAIPEERESTKYAIEWLYVPVPPTYPLIASTIASATVAAEGPLLTPTPITPSSAEVSPVLSVLDNLIIIAEPVPPASDGTVMLKSSLVE